MYVRGLFSLLWRPPHGSACWDQEACNNSSEDYYKIIIFFMYYPLKDGVKKTSPLLIDIIENLGLQPLSWLNCCVQQKICRAMIHLRPF